MSAWVIIALTWYVMGLACYAAILRFFPPTPRIRPESPDAPAKEPEPRPFSFREVPSIVVVSVLMAVVSPLFLILLFCHWILNQKRAA